MSLVKTMWGKLVVHTMAWELKHGIVLGSGLSAKDIVRMRADKNYIKVRHPVLRSFPVHTSSVVHSWGCAEPDSYILLVSKVLRYYLCYCHTKQYFVRRPSMQLTCWTQQTL